MRIITLLAMMGAILVVAVGIAYGYVTFVVQGGQQEGGGSSQAQLVDACRDVKEVRCNQGGISKGDYPSNCIVNGQHVLDNPYTCPG
ncbi:MAG: hypothetical protein SV186_05230 [Candidatus Nanohaloarchaea archaeon]|nr:hypothetical protein [Candidatus Nanohaloarchaea archaeon]